MLEYCHFVSNVNTLAKATYLRVSFRFDKGGTGNLQGWTFHRFPVEISSFCPLPAAICDLDHWTTWDLNPLTSISCYQKMKLVTFIHDYIVTKNLREVTLKKYPNPNNFYNLHLKDAHTHSVLVIACIILVVAKISDATIKHIIR